MAAIPADHHKNHSSGLSGDLSRLTEFSREESVPNKQEVEPPRKLFNITDVIPPFKCLRFQGTRVALAHLRQPSYSGSNKVTQVVIRDVCTAFVIVAAPQEDPVKQIETIKTIRKRFQSTKNLSVLGFKIFADGVLEYPTQTAAVSIPYANSGRYGSLLVDPEKLQFFVTLADKNNLLIHVHAIGDRAVTESLNAFAAARASNQNKTIPHSITHLQLVVPTDYPRFASLNILCSMQLLWANADLYAIDLVKPYIDSTLYRHQYPAKSLLDAGAVLCGASDWPVSFPQSF